MGRFPSLALLALLLCSLNVRAEPLERSRTIPDSVRATPPPEMGKRQLPALPGQPAGGNGGAGGGTGGNGTGVVIPGNLPWVDFLFRRVVAREGDGWSTGSGLG